MWERRDPPGPTHQPSEAESSPGSAAPSRAAGEADDPYADLEAVFDEPVVLEELELETLDEPAPASAAAAPPASDEAGQDQPDKAQDAPEGIDEMAGALWARLGALENEIRRGSDRTLEALRRLGERMGAELGMLDKRAINLELTVARLRALTEVVEAGMRRQAEIPTKSEPAAAPRAEASPSREPAFTLEEAPATPDPDPVWDPPIEPEDPEPPQESLPGTQPSPSDWRHPSFGPPPDDEPPDER